MKFILLFFVAFASANLFEGNLKEVRVDGDQRIVIKCPKSIVIITKTRSDDRGLKLITKEAGKPVEYVLIDRNKNIVKKGVVNDENEDELSEDDRKILSSNSLEESTVSSSQKDSESSQIKILCEIFRKYTGMLSDKTVCSLLTDVKKYADLGKFNSVVFTQLKSKCPCGSASLESGSSDKLDLRSSYLPSTDKKNILGKIRDYNKPLHTLQEDYYSELYDDDRSPTGKWTNSRTTNGFDELYDKNKDLENNIQDLQIEIIQLQFRLQQLQLQQQLLRQEKQRLTVNLRLSFRRGVWSNDLKRELQKIAGEEVRALEERLSLSLRVRRLQDNIVKQLEEAERNLKKESWIQENYYENY